VHCNRTVFLIGSQNVFKYQNIQEMTHLQGWLRKFKLYRNLVASPLFLFFLCYLVSLSLRVCVCGIYSHSTEDAQREEEKLDEVELEMLQLKKPKKKEERTQEQLQQRLVRRYRLLLARLE
jgi:hypothetical protein